MPATRVLATLLALALLLPALAAQAVPRDDILQLMDEVDRFRLNQTLLWLQDIGDPTPGDANHTGTRCSASDNAWFTVNAILDSLISFGWDAGLEQFTFDHAELGPITTWNVIARRDGWNADGMIVMGCHWDTVDEKLPDEIPGNGDDAETPYTSFDDPNNPAPGADDNGSGTSAMLEMARILGSSGFRQDVELCFFGAEELGIEGSKHHVETLDAAGINVAGYFNVDMIGFDEEGPFDFRLFYDPQSGWFKNFVTGFIDDYTIMNYDIAIVGDSWSNSDLLHFWQTSKPAVGFWEGLDHAPFWNQSLDTFDDSISGSGTFLREMTKTILACFCEWADVQMSTPAEELPFGATVLQAWPNPFRPDAGGATLRFSRGHRGLGAELVVFDVQGRAQRRLVTDGDGNAHWDGRDARGKALPAGVYLARPAGARDARAERIVLLR